MTLLLVYSMETTKNIDADYFCDTCKKFAEMIIEENGKLESDCIVYEQEMNRLLSKKRRERFTRSDELLS